MLKKLKNLTRTKKILISVAIVCVFVLIGVLVYNNSRYSDKYLEKIKTEIYDELYTEFVLNSEYYPWEEEFDGDNFAVNVIYEKRVVEVFLDARNKYNEKTKAWLDKEYGDLVVIREGYYIELDSEKE